MSQEISLFWFRRDLRLDDNVGFLASLKEEHPVMPIFIFGFKHKRQYCVTLYIFNKKICV